MPAWCKVARKYNQIRRDKLKAATIPKPEISRNFRATDGIGTRARAPPSLGNQYLFQQSSLGSHPLRITVQPLAEPHATLGVAQILVSPASSGPLPKYQTLLTSLPSDVHVKEDSGVTGVGGLSLGGRVRHTELQMRLGANSDNLVDAQHLRPQSYFLRDDLSAALTSYFRCEVGKPRPDFRRLLPASFPRAGARARSL